MRFGHFSRQGESHQAKQQRICRLAATSKREPSAQKQTATFTSIDPECMSLVVYTMVPAPVQSGTHASASTCPIYSTAIVLALNPGARLGPYEILSALGAGGMGEVYRARDTKLNRDVAIKVLPESFASDAERLARFTREAQTLASLNHPNIAHIHGLEESDGVRALVMELVEGEICRSASRAGRSRSTRRCRSRGRSPRRSKRRTSRGSSIAISSPRTSRSRPTAR